MQLGGLVTIIVYFTVFGTSGYSVSGLHAALFVALAIQSGYVALASSQGELKQFDVGLWLMFALGAAAALANVAPVVGGSG